MHHHQGTSIQQADGSPHSKSKEDKVKKESKKIKQSHESAVTTKAPVCNNNSSQPKIDQKNKHNGVQHDKTVLVRQKGKSTLAIDNLGPAPTVAQSPRGRVGTTSNTAHTHTRATDQRQSHCRRPQRWANWDCDNASREHSTLHLRSGSVRRVVSVLLLLR